MVVVLKGSALASAPNPSIYRRPLVGHVLGLHMLARTSGVYESLEKWHSGLTTAQQHLKRKMEQARRHPALQNGVRFASHVLEQAELTAREIGRKPDTFLLLGLAAGLTAVTAVGMGLHRRLRSTSEGLRRTAEIYWPAIITAATNVAGLTVLSLGQALGSGELLVTSVAGVVAGMLMAGDAPLLGTPVLPSPIAHARRYIARRRDDR